ncbi:hypothetical protein FTO60_04730 [Octadecabacter sp. SW4]|nr:hypothetical protein FTO60_04730 [Octadecabacter sp. SW4]
MSGGLHLRRQGPQGGPPRISAHPLWQAAMRVRPPCGLDRGGQGEVRQRPARSVPRGHWGPLVAEQRPIRAPVQSCPTVRPVARRRALRQDSARQWFGPDRSQPAQSRKPERRGSV